MSRLWLFVIAGAICINCSEQDKGPRVVSFWDYQFEPRMASVKGQILNYQIDSSVSPKGEIIITPLLELEQIKLSFDISKDGRFLVSFRIINPQEVLLKAPYLSTEVYVAPERIAELNYDILRAKEIENEFGAFQTENLVPITFSGDLAHINNPLISTKPNINDIFHDGTNLIKLGEGLQSMKYKHWREAMWKEQLAWLQNFYSEWDTHEDFKTIMKQRLRFHYINDLLRYRWLPDVHSKSSVQFARVDDEYVDFMLPDYFNDPNALLTQFYPRVLHELAYLNQNSDDTRYYQELLQFSKNVNSLLPEEEIILRKAALLEQNKGSSDSVKVMEQELRPIRLKYNDEIKKYFGEKNLRKKLGFYQDTIPRGQSRDLMVARLVLQYLAWHHKFDVGQLDQIVEDHIESKEIADMVLDKALYITSKDEHEFSEEVHILNSVSNKAESAFSTLIDQFRNKVIYIDFWAPWCTPCMAEMPHSKEIETEFNDSNVVFLYYAINCTKESWERTIKLKELTGHHYHGSDEEYKYLYDKFKVTGIPRYVLIGKDGKVIDGHAPRPSETEELVFAIERALTL